MPGLPTYAAYLKAAEVIPDTMILKLHRAGFAIVEVGDATGEPLELRDLPPEVRALVHCVDSMADNWAEGDDVAKKELWRRLHQATRAVWDRHDDVVQAIAHSPA